LAQFAGSFGRHRSDQLPVQLPPGYGDPATSQNLRLAVDAAAAAGAAAALAAEQLAPLVDEAVEQLQTVIGEDVSEVLEEVVFEIVDLPGDVLGRQLDESLVQIDVNAAGIGWFVDTTPWDDAEFVRAGNPYESTAVNGTPAAGRVDLWTTVLHELGHVLGYDHTAVGIMEDTLAPGTRRLWEDLASPFDFDSKLIRPSAPLTPATVAAAASP
jgi:hypothetical protein